jgi:hypothetical protein
VSATFSAASAICSNSSTAMPASASARSGPQDRLRELRREARGRGSSSMSAFGRIMSARETASICCSPRDSEPPGMGCR